MIVSSCPAAVSTADAWLWRNRHGLNGSPAGSFDRDAESGCADRNDAAPWRRAWGQALKASTRRLNQR
jgi:hypothetical protein